MSGFRLAVRAYFNDISTAWDRWTWKKANRVMRPNALQFVDSTNEYTRVYRVSRPQPEKTLGGGIEYRYGFFTNKCLNSITYDIIIYIARVVWLGNYQNRGNYREYRYIPVCKITSFIDAVSQRLKRLVTFDCTPQ